jgi:hypothetical protein
MGSTGAGPAAERVGVRSVGVWVAAVGVALTLPSLWAGLYLDDYVLWTTATRAPALRDVFSNPLDMFAFIDGDPGRTRLMMDRGILPWWTFETARLAFWRPTTSLTHWLDFTLLAHRPALMHLHSVAWFAVLLMVVTLAYRRLIGRTWVVGAAALLYATNGANALGVAWIASRSVLLATVSGVLCLWAHDRWRRSGWRPGASLSPLLLALGLSCAEGALGIVAYLFAHAVFLDPDARWRRALALVPCAVVSGAWLLLYRGLGYGLFAVSPMFVNPMDEPLPFLRRLVEHGPLLLASQWLGLPADSSVGVGWPVALLALTGIGLAVIPLLRRDSVARFWCLGHVLALLPLATAPLMARYTSLVGLGAMALLAMFVAGVFDRDRWLPLTPVVRWAASALAVVLVAIHATVSPAQLALISARFTGATAVIDRAAPGIAPDAGRPRQRIVVVRAPRSVFVVLPLLMRAARNEPIGAGTIALTYTAAPLQVSRVDARTLVVIPRGEQEFLLAPRDLRPGQTIRLSGVNVRVDALSPEGRPLETRFTFDAALEEPSLKWIQWSAERDGYTTFTPPTIGETVIIR